MSRSLLGFLGGHVVETLGLRVLNLLIQINEFVFYAVKRCSLARRLGKIIRKHTDIWTHESSWNRSVHLLFLAFELAEVVTVVF